MDTLRDVKIGETVTVARVHGEGPVKRRIMDMGVTKGTSIPEILIPVKLLYLMP